MQGLALGLALVPSAAGQAWQSRPVQDGQPSLGQSRPVQDEQA